MPSVDSILALQDLEGDYEDYGCDDIRADLTSEYQERYEQLAIMIWMSERLRDTGEDQGKQEAAAEAAELLRQAFANIEAAEAKIDESAGDQADTTALAGVLSASLGIDL